MNEILGVADIAAIEKLAEIVEKKELAELSFENGDKKITIKGKRKTEIQQQTVVPVAAVTESHQKPQHNNKTKRNDSPAPARANVEPFSGNIVRAPIVGTFYSSPSPDSQPFVSIGSKVKKGDIIMIIESMKLMNEIPCEFDGVVEKIFVTDGDSVEYDQPLMVIR